MDLYKTIIDRRTIRSFKPKALPFLKLKKIINAARLAPSGANLQPLEYILVIDKKICAQVFAHLRWAAYIRPLGIPAFGRRPTAYISVLANLKRANKDFFPYDVGAAVENILLAAAQEGVGTCWLRSIERNSLKRLLRIPRGLYLDSIVALGYPDESPCVEKFRNSLKYWKDKKGRLHVPKRSLKEILHLNRY